MADDQAKTRQQVYKNKGKDPDVSIYFKNFYIDYYFFNYIYTI